MRKDLIFNLLLVAAAYLLPLIGTPERYSHAAPWLALAAAVVTLFTQPALTPQEMAARGTADRRSALWIFVTMFVAQMTAVLDFGYLQRGTPWGPLATSGLVLAVAGLCFRIWSIRTLGRFFTSTVQVQAGQRVVNRGPYKLLRHPSYTGAIATAIGTCLVLGSPLGVLAVMAFVLPAYVHRMHAEERALTAQLGDDYARYARSTRRLLPFVY
jgi:protein-S-isoprenylcysteine O-methyltransferase Ste14